VDQSTSVFVCVRVCVCGQGLCLWVIASRRGGTENTGVCISVIMVGVQGAWLATGRGADGSGAFICVYVYVCTCEHSQCSGV